MRTGVGHDDADDVEGTIACDDAIGFDPLPLLRSLDVHGAQVVVMGQIAGILHGSQELTGDLDLLWSGTPTEALAMSAGFAAMDATMSDDDGVRLPSSAETFGRAKVQFHTLTASGDCCTPALPWGALNIEAMLDRADSAMIDGVRIRYVSRLDLIAMRSAVGRPKDLRRTTELKSL